MLIDGWWQDSHQCRHGRNFIIRLWFMLQFCFLPYTFTTIHYMSWRAGGNNVCVYPPSIWHKLYRLIWRWYRNKLVWFKKKNKKTHTHLKQWHVVTYCSNALEYLLLSFWWRAILLWKVASQRHSLDETPSTVLSGAEVSPCQSLCLAHKHSGH